MTAHDPRVTLTEVEVERLRIGVDRDETGEGDNTTEHLIAEVERIIAARLAPIRELVDEWQDLGDVTCGGCDSCDGAQRYLWHSAADALRATLNAPVSASQDHDGAEGQGEVPWSRQRVHIHPPYEPTCNERRVDGQLRGACLNDDGSPR